MQIEVIVNSATRRYLAILSEHLRSADGKAFYTTDLVIFGLINRNLGLLRAMPALVKERNIHALAPLLRVQLDGLLRLNAFRIVRSMDDLSRHLLKGNSLRKFNGPDGKPLTDARLVSELQDALPWVKSMYDTLSGWVHLSEQHIFSAATPGDGERSIVLAVGNTEAVSPQLIAEATDAIKQVHLATAELIQNYFNRPAVT